MSSRLISTESVWRSESTERRTNTFVDNEENIEHIQSDPFNDNNNCYSGPHILEGNSPISIWQRTPIQPGLQTHSPEPSMPSSQRPCFPQSQAEKEK